MTARLGLGLGFTQLEYVEKQKSFMKKQRCKLFMFESRRQQNYQEIKQLLIINLPLLRNLPTGLIERSLNSFQRLLNPRGKKIHTVPY